MPCQASFIFLGHLALGRFMARAADPIRGVSLRWVRAAGCPDARKTQEAAGREPARFTRPVACGHPGNQEPDHRSFPLSRRFACLLRALAGIG